MITVPSAKATKNNEKNYGKKGTAHFENEVSQINLKRKMHYSILK